MKLYRRLKKYIGNIIWMKRKRKEIWKELAWINMNLAIFETRRNNFDTRDGTGDLSMNITYKLRKTSDSGHRYIMGTSTENFGKMKRSLMKASLILIRFERREKYKGWLHDKMAINRKDRELLRAKQKTITDEFAGVSTFDSDVSIPD